MEIAQLNRLLTVAIKRGPLLPPRLPALGSLMKTVPSPGAVRAILITHVMHTAVEYIEKVNEVFPISRIIAIPYSMDPSAVELLQSSGFNLVLPSSISDTFVKARNETIAALRESTTPPIVQEVGGYLASYTQELARYRNFKGTVEDTNNGHWRYEKTGPHPCPVLSMAQSPLKYVEDTIIGDAVMYSIERILREDYCGILQGIRAAVIGFGKIGRSTAVSLKGRETVVSIYDINPAKDMSAKVEGFFPKPLHDLLPESEIVVGCTGQTSIRDVDMPFIRDGAILASASSKDIEFALKAFAEKCTVENIAEHITKYIQPNGKFFYVLYNGSPVNFRDKSILGTILDMIYCELFVCMREVAANRVDLGLQKSMPALQDEVAKAWLRAHSEDFSSAIDDKVWDYPKSLELGLPPSQ